jgi:DNA polymerase theta
VAEIIVLKRIVETQKRAIIVLPFISIVNELKAKWVSRYAEYGLNIASYFGSSNGPVFEEFDIAICTIEKANSLINRLLEEGKMELLSTLVIDEIHLIGNDNRGYLLELMLTKIRALSLQIKVVGMSATLPDIDVISNWLNSTLYISKYRPIPIAEYIKVKDSILSKFGTEVRKISMDAKEAKKRGDHDMLVPIVQEVVVKGNSVIVFCSKKNDCENTAKLLSRLMTIDYDDSFKDKLIHARKLLVEEMRYADGGLDGQLANIIFNGVAYHHSGLTSEERSLIENGFRSGCISVICATSTLASGVNLPCARVIFRSPYIGKKFLDNLDYQQM